MVSAKKIKKYTKRESGADLLRQPDYAQLSDTFHEGVSAIVESMNLEEISEEQGHELIKLLFAAYMEATIGRQIVDYLDRGITDTLLRGIEERKYSGGR